MKVWLKRALVQMSVGAVLGFIGWSLLGKNITSMLYGSLGGSFSCQTDVAAGLDKFLRMQVYSAIGGALVVFLAVTFVRYRWSKRKGKAVAPTPAPGVS